MYGMKEAKYAFQSLVIVGAFACAAPASAAVTQITTPDLAYTSGTTQLAITGADFSSISSLSDAFVTVSFDTGDKRTAPGGGWSTWGSPPDTEPTPTPVIYTNGLTTITFNFSKALSTFGFEAEPNPFSLQNFSVEYFLGGVSQGTIARAIDGSAAARLLAASGTFDKAMVTASTDFAFGRVRYDVSAVPEPATWGMMIIGFGAVGSLLRASRRREGFAQA